MTPTGHNRLVGELELDTPLELPVGNVHVHGQLVIQLDPFARFVRIARRVVHDLVQHDGAVQHQSSFECLGSEVGPRSGNGPFPLAAACQAIKSSIRAI